jgi:hypothetical protein
MTEVVKVQRALNNNNWLIYDRERKHVQERDGLSVPAYVHEAMGDDTKAFFEGAWSSVVGWGLSSRVEEQGW